LRRMFFGIFLPPVSPMLRFPECLTSLTYRWRGFCQARRGCGPIRRIRGSSAGFKRGQRRDEVMITTQEIKRLSVERDNHREAAHRINRELHELRRIERQRIAAEKAEARRTSASVKRKEALGGKYETLRLRVLLADVLRDIGKPTVEIEKFLGVRMSQVRQNRLQLLRAERLTAKDAP
jgi:hypothetical protein